MEDRFSVEELLRETGREAEIPSMDSKVLERQINRRIAAIVTRVLVILAVAVALLLCIIHPVMKLVTYDYKAKSDTIVEQETGENGLTQYLSAYTSVFMPYLEVYDAEVKGLGFGRYVMTLHVNDHRERWIQGSAENEVEYRVFGAQWECTKNDNSRFVWELGRFSEGLLKAPEEILPQLEELPDSAVIFCSVRLAQAVLPEELWQDGITVHWLRVAQKINKAEAGIRIQQNTWEPSEEVSRTEMTGVQLREVFASELALLLSDTELLEPLGVVVQGTAADGTISGGGIAGSQAGITMLQQLLDYVQGLETVRTREVCLSGKKADVMAFIENMDVQGVHVEDVWMSQWTK